MLACVIVLEVFSLVFGTEFMYLHTLSEGAVKALAEQIGHSGLIYISP